MTRQEQKDMAYKRNGAQRANFFSLPQYLISPTMLSFPLMLHFLPQSSSLSHNPHLFPTIPCCIPRFSILSHNPPLSPTIYSFSTTILSYFLQFSISLTISHISHKLPFSPVIYHFSYFPVVSNSLFSLRITHLPNYYLTHHSPSTPAITPFTKLFILSADFLFYPTILSPTSLHPPKILHSPPRSSMFSHNPISYNFLYCPTICLFCTIPCTVPQVLVSATILYSPTISCFSQSPFSSTIPCFPTILHYFPHSIFSHNPPFFSIIFPSIFHSLPQFLVSPTILYAPTIPFFHTSLYSPTIPPFSPNPSSLPQFHSNPTSLPQFLLFPTIFILSHNSILSHSHPSLPQFHSFPQASILSRLLLFPTICPSLP